MQNRLGKAERPYAIVIGLDGLNGIQTARILARRNIPVIGIAKDRWHPYCSTWRCKRIIAADTGSEQCIEALEALKPGLCAKAVLFPCEDESVLLLSRHRGELTESYHLALPAPEVVETMVDKVSFYRYADEHGLPIPPTVFLHEPPDVRRAAREVGFPCLVKPARRTATWMRDVEVKAFRVYSEAELAEVYKRYRSHAEALVAQSWIDGADTDLYACNCYFNAASEPLVAFTSKKIRQWPPHAGRGSFGVECRQDTVQSQTIELFRSLDYYGLGYLEMKRERSSGEFLIVEPNIGRPTGRSALAETAGVEFLSTMYCDVTGLPLPEARQQHYRDVKWIYLRQDVQSAVCAWRSGEAGLREILSSWRGKKVYAIFSWSDPAPFLLDLAWIMIRMLSARGRAFWGRVGSQARGERDGTAGPQPEKARAQPLVMENTAKNRDAVAGESCGSRDENGLGVRLAQFMELRGRRIVEACGVVWHLERGFLMSCPYEARLNPDPEELKQVLRSKRAAGARFSSVTWPGLPGGSYLFLRRKYSLESIHPQYRRKVRRGQEQLEIRQVERPELLAQGLQLNLDTMRRQGRRDREFGNEKRWRRFVDAVYRSPGIYAIGAFRGTRLAAYCVLCRECRGLYILHHMSRTPDLGLYPNHLLTYEITHRASEDEGIDFVSYGLGSPARAGGLHDYKSRFGYAYCPQNSVIVLHPWLAPMLSNPVRRMARSMQRLRPRDNRLNKIETVISGAFLTKSGA